MKPYYLICLIALLLVFSCKKKKNKNCEFHRIEYVVLEEKNGDLKDDQTILECLQMEYENGVYKITNEAKTINIKFSISSENIVENLDLKLDGKVSESINATDEQEMELKKQNRTWEIMINSDNKSKLNGSLKLYKNNDGDFWKKEQEGIDVS